MRRTIYVVDDQAAVMETVVLALKSLGRDWEVIGFREPFAALDAVKISPPHALLTDQVMPGMQGTELLEQVRLLAPNTIRLIMSGCVALDKLTLVTSAHQYLAKPFDAIELRNVLARSFAAQDRMLNHGLQTLATSIRSIPSLPQAHYALLAELEDYTTGATSIARRIKNDPGLSIKVLHLANSSLFGRGSTVTNLNDAVGCLGTDMIAAIVLAQSIFHHYEGLKGRDIDLERIWSHCWETASMTQQLCREKHLPGKVGEEAFLAGLLHEMGRFILVDNFPNEYQAACEAARKTNLPLTEHLRETFQASPAQLTAYILELWGLPKDIIDSVACLEHPGNDRAGEFTMTAALYVAHHLASQKYPPDSFPIEPWDTGYLKAVGCADDLEAWEKLPIKKEEAVQA